MKTRIALLCVLLLAGANRGLATQSVLFDSNRWPLTNGMFVGLQTAQFANGIVLSNFTCRAFSDSVALPPPGGSTVVSFSSTAKIQVSGDGGATFSSAQATANAVVRINHSSDSRGASTFDTEMLQLNLSGGTLPGGIMIRESPTKASAGQTQTRSTSNGNLVTSFFDVFLEVSLDGGQNWAPGLNSGRIELRADPMSMPSDIVPTPLLPPPCCAYTNAGSFFASYPIGIVLQNTKMHFFNSPAPAPGTNGTQIYTSAPQLDFQFSSNGGLTFSQGRAPASLVMIVRYRMNLGATQVFDTEMLSLNLQGGDLPSGVMIRESPSIASAGGLTLTATNGVYRIQSFFDLWTELSVDGGQTWMPTTAPSRLLLDCPAVENPFPAPTTPPPTGRYVSLGQYWVLYAKGIVIRNMVIHSPSQSLPPPAPGGSQSQAFKAQTEFQFSTDGGQTFSPGSAPANVSVRVQSSTDNGNTRYFDTEMLQLNVSGGTLPSGMMIRESPTRASLGCLSERTTAADYRISSFFDVFTEISLDGGQTWSPSIGPGEILLFPPLSADLRLTKTVNLGTALVGQMISYNITVSNLGPDAASGVVMTDLLPKNFTFNSLGASQGSFSLASNAVICYLTNLAAGAGATIVINATPDSPGLGTNSAGVVANELDPNLSNNSATVVTPAQLPLLSVNLIQGNLLVSWPAAAGGFRLLQRTNFLPRTLWEAVTNQSFANGDRLVVKFTPPPGMSFFELTRP